MASSSRLFFTCTVVVLLFSIFCLRLRLRVGAMRAHFLLGVFLPLPASCFSELVIFRKNLLHIFSQVLGLSLGLLFLFFSVPYFGLAYYDHGNSFLFLEE